MAIASVSPVNAAGSNDTQLTGKAFGSSPPWAMGREYDKATDGDPQTFFDYAFADGGYTGIDLGVGGAKRVTRIFFQPRKSFGNGNTLWNEGPRRMIGGKFQGSNTSQTSGYTDLFTITTAPAADIFTVVTVKNVSPCRYLRYLGPNGSYGDVAEIQFFTSDDPTTPGYSLELVQNSAAPLIDRSNPGSAGNRHGYEGGTAFIYKTDYHLFVTEEMAGWDLTRTGHWKSHDGTNWARVGTVQNSISIPKNPRHAIWSPMPVYNFEEGRWNIFYVGYEQNGTYHGRVFRAYSLINGYDGLNGPYADTAGSALSYTDLNKHPWEGDQGTDSFYVYKSGDKWWGFYGSAGTSDQWCVGLASASSLAGVWSRVADAQPAFSFAENPIVIALDDHTLFCVYDDLAHGISNCHSIGYGYSTDGINWTSNYLNILMPGWATNIRTPQSLIPAGGGEYWIYFTANTASGFDCVGRLKVRLKILK